MTNSIQTALTLLNSNLISSVTAVEMPKRRDNTLTLSEKAEVVDLKENYMLRFLGSMVKKIKSSIGEIIKRNRYKACSACTPHFQNIMSM